jgi:uncharacterized glyoxalase superfamily protein PhnB
MHHESSLSVVLWTTDVFGLVDFLAAVTGFGVAERHPGYAALDIGGLRLMIHADESYRGHPWYDALRKEGAARGIGAELRFQVEDVEAAYRQALNRGAQSIAAPYNSGQCTECSVMGPDCFLISLWHE